MFMYMRINAYTYTYIYTHAHTHPRTYSNTHTAVGLVVATLGRMDSKKNPTEPTYGCGLRIFRNPSEPTRQHPSPQCGKA